MTCYSITMGDFLKNAGIVGLYSMLEDSSAIKGQDYGISEDRQSLWLEAEFAKGADWTELYFQTFVKRWSTHTVYQGILDRIQRCLDKLEKQIWEGGKAEKEDLKFINDKLFSNSYQTGFSNIEYRIEKPEVYLALKEKKLSEKEEPQVLQQRLEELKAFLNQPLCKETFAMKSIVYNFINRFWNGKCFLNRTNAKKDMREVFEAEFSAPLRHYWEQEHKKDKELCIDCGMPMDNKERVSITFMNGMADDLARKRSTFWNYKADAFLCPVCAFVYAASPLGFGLFANKFLFVNANDDLEGLLRANSAVGKEQLEAQKEENERYSAWFSRMLNGVLAGKTKELSNVQVILRGTREEDSYMFHILGRDTLLLLSNEKIKGALEYLGRYPFIQIENELQNIYEKVVMNLLQLRTQYPLVDQLLRKSLDAEMGNGRALQTAYKICSVQLWTRILKRGQKDKGEKIEMSWITMRNNGYHLRKALMIAKGTESEDSIRGTTYQLVNALSVRNTEKFMEIVLRLYISTKEAMPDGFVYMLQDPEIFAEYGYAFVLGLKGSFSENRKTEEKKEEN